MHLNQYVEHMKTNRWILLQISNHKFSSEFPKLLQSIVFRSNFICVEELNYIKDYVNTKSGPITSAKQGPQTLNSTFSVPA